MRKFKKLTALLPAIMVLSALPVMTSHAFTYGPGLTTYQPGERNVIEVKLESDENMAAAGNTGFSLSGMASSDTTVSQEISTNSYGNVYTFKVSVAENETADRLVLAVQSTLGLEYTTAIDRFDKHIYHDSEQYIPGSSMEFVINIGARFTYSDAYILGGSSGTQLTDLGDIGNQQHALKIDFAPDEASGWIALVVQMYDSYNNRLYGSIHTTVYKDLPEPPVPPAPVPVPSNPQSSGSGAQPQESGESAQPQESGYIKFIENTMEMIEKISLADSKDAITIDTGDWVSFPRSVYEKLQERNKSADITINYTYKGIAYTVTIPAGSDLLSLLDENGYCGFRYLDKVFGGSAVIK